MTIRIQNPGLQLSEIDRLTSQVGALSTLILTDDSTDQTLTGSLGDLVLAPTSKVKLLDDKAMTFGEDEDINVDFDSALSVLHIDGPVHIGASGGGKDFVLHTDTAGKSLTFDPSPATVNDPHLQMDIYDGQNVYFRVTGSSANPSTSANGILDVTPAFTGSASSLVGQNIMFFHMNDARSVTSSGGIFTRICSGQLTRSGTKTGTGTAESTEMLYMVVGDSMTYSDTGQTQRTGYRMTGSSTFGVTGSCNYYNRGMLMDHGMQWIQVTGAPTPNAFIYGTDISPTFNTLITSGSLTSTMTGFRFTPTLTATPTNVQAFYATAGNIEQLVDGSSGSTTAGVFYQGAGSDWERYFDGTDGVNDLANGGSFKWLISGGTEMTLAANTLTFEAGATDPVLDWSTSGLLKLSTGDFQVDAEFKGGRLLLSFGDTAALTADSYMEFAGRSPCSATIGARMPRAGSIVGASFETDITAHSTDGYLDMLVQKNGATVYTVSGGDVTGTGAFGAHGTQARGTDTFAAGDLIQVQMDHEGGISNFTYTDTMCLVEVQFDT